MYLLSDCPQKRCAGLVEGNYLRLPINGGLLEASLFSVTRNYFIQRFISHSFENKLEVLQLNMAFFSKFLKSAKALIFTPRTNLLPWIISTVVQFTCDIKGPSNMLSCSRSYGLQPLLTAQNWRINLLVTETLIFMGWPMGMSFVLQMCNLATAGQDNIQHCNHYVSAVTFSKF